MTLAEFLLARVAEDEGAARATGTPGLYAYEEGGGDGWAVEGTDGSEGAIIGARALAEHIARHDPTRVLAECQARRAVIDWVDRWGEDDEVLRLLVQPFKGHPDFDPAWAVCAAG